MDYLEKLLMKVSRFFVFIIMTILLLGIIIIISSITIKSIAEKLERKTPLIEFNKADFTEVTVKIQQPGTIDKSEEDRNSQLVKESIDKIMPVYEKLIVTVNKEESVREDKKNKEENKNRKNKKDKNVKVVTEDKESKINKLSNDIENDLYKQWLNDIKKYNSEYGEGFGSSYIKGFVEYILDAEKESNISADYELFQKVKNKYEKDFETRAIQMRAERSGKAGWEGLIHNTIFIVVIGSLFTMIMLFLSFGVMFSIMRIEKKIDNKL